MKKILTITMMVVGMFAFADNADLPLGYRSAGVDTYGDGKTPVLDGECYALVWMAEGSDFAGFKYDGTLVDPVNNDIVSDDGFHYVVPCAKDGKSAPLAFIVKETYRIAHRDGAYRVVVLDTRVTANSLAGLNDDGTLRRVNGWGWANVNEASAKRLMGAALSVGALTDVAAHLPAGCDNLKIKSFSFDAEGNAVMTVQGTKSFLSYRAMMGATPAAVGEEKGETLVPGANDEEELIEIVIPKAELAETAGFFSAEAKTDWTK